MRAFITAVLLLSVTALIYGEEATSQSPTPTPEPTSTKTLAKLKNDTETKKTTASAEKAKSSDAAKGTQTTDAKSKVMQTDKVKEIKADKPQPVAAKAAPTMSVKKGSMHKHRPMHDEPAKASDKKKTDLSNTTAKSKLAGKANTSDSTKGVSATVTDPPDTKGSGLSPLPNWRLVTVVVAGVTVILNLI
ncbi:triadin-like [Haliotis cracherodii]|uniref:triadin-like n=1 Tax=Haliotis cracherodii TaxID=6455 RepID=UPI0039E8732C